MIAAQSSATTVVNVNAATAPTSGQVLTATGSTAATWQTPVGLLAFADFYALMPGDNTDTIAVGAPMLFPQNGPTFGSSITRVRSTSTFTLVAAGIYEVQWQVSVTEAGQLVVKLDGAVVANTVSGRATGTSQIVGTCLITATAEQVLSIINPAGNAAALAITPIAGGASAVSAHLIIKRLT